MLPTKIYIFKWIFILLFTRANGFAFLRMDDVSGNRLLVNIANYLRGTSFFSPKSEYLNKIVTRGGPRDRRSLDNIKVFKNKVLIKRAVPHGYRGNYEYDEKFQTLYKPLVRIHKRPPDDFNDSNGKIEPDSRYDAIFIVDENDIKKPSNDVLEDLHMNEQHSGYNNKNDKPKEYRGAEIEDVILSFNRDNKSVKYDDKDDEATAGHGEIQLLAFGPMGMMKAKQLRKTPKSTAKNIFLSHIRSLLRSVEKKRQDYKTNWSKQSETRNRSRYNDDTDVEFIDHIIGIITDKRSVEDDDDIRKKDDLIKQITKSIEHNNHDSHIEYNDRIGESSDDIRIKRDRMNDYYMYRWFGPVGQITGKQSKRQKFAESRMDTGLEGKMFSSVKQYPAKRKESIISMKKVIGTILKSRIDPKSAEEHDPLTPKNLFLGKYPEDEESSTEKPMWLPNYPIHNFWTYDKTLYQDECKGNTVKLGNICVAIPAQA